MITALTQAQYTELQRLRREGKLNYVHLLTKLNEYARPPAPEPVYIEPNSITLNQNGRYVPSVDWSEFSRSMINVASRVNMLENAYYNYASAIPINMRWNYNNFSVSDNS